MFSWVNTTIFRNLGCKFLTVTVLANNEAKEIEFENLRYEKKVNGYSWKCHSAKDG